VIRGILAALLLLFAPATAHAFQLCAISASGVAFGEVAGASTRSVGSITIACIGTGRANYTLTLSAGSSGSFASREMRNGAHVLSYNLFRDPALAQAFGDGTGGSTGVSGQIGGVGGIGGPETALVPVYGKVLDQPIPAAGAYADTIVATLSCSDLSCNTATTSFEVTASVAAGCTISATNLVFGDYTQAQLDGQSHISLNCTTGSAWNVGLSQGAFPGATVTTRRMTGPGTFSLMYALFRDAARTLNWGNTIGSNTVSGIGTGSAQALPVFGRVPPSQAAGPGGYVDTIIATITF
jgi:spore coat protein U-like protein